MKKKHGLSRYIPADIKREIRIRSKFGCVVCRKAYCQYEHIEPEFKHALVHTADHMCLLCGGCEDKVSRGALSKDTVWRNYHEVQTNKTIKPPYDDFDLSSHQLLVRLGSSYFENCKSLIEIDGETLLALQPSDDGAPFPQLTGVFFDEEGTEIFRINNNIWTPKEPIGDITCVGKKITLEGKNGRVLLRLRVEPPNEIHIEKLVMRYKDYRFAFANDDFSVGYIQPDREFVLGFRALRIAGGQSCVCLSSREVATPPRIESFSADSQGIKLHGTGITLGKEAGHCTMLGMRIEVATKSETTICEWPFESNLSSTVRIEPPRI